MPIVCPRCQKEIPADTGFCTECGEDNESSTPKRQNTIFQPASPGSGPLPKESRTEHKKLNNTSLFPVLALGILIIMGILFFSGPGTFVAGITRDVPSSNISGTPVPEPAIVPLQPTFTAIPVLLSPDKDVPNPAGITPELTLTATLTAPDDSCTNNIPGTWYNPITRQCEVLSQVPQPQPTPGIGQQAPAVSPSDTSEVIYRDFSWNYQGTDWRWNGGFPASGYEYYKSRSHTRENNYAEYALSDYDRTMIQGIVQKFKDGGIQKGYTENDNVLNIVSFVQSLPYTSDKVTTGYDEYPRYPIETLVDNGGDCEDTAILTAALVDELGYGVVLIRLPDHMAVGIRGSDDMSGTSYEFLGSRYYYLETTGQGWEIGEIPAEYANREASIFPMVQIPMMDMKCYSTVEKADALFVYYHQRCEIENAGVGTAKNPKMYFAALALDKGADMVWETDQTVNLDDFSEGATGFAETILKIPPHERTQIIYEIHGDNFEPVKHHTEIFSS